MHEPQIERCEKSVSKTLERPLDRFNGKKKNFSTKGIMIYLIYMEEEKMRRAT